MPLISNHSKSRSKRFEKKAYRPWDDDLITSTNQKIINDVSSDKNLSEELNTPNTNKTRAKLEQKLLHQENIAISSDYLTEVSLKKELRNLFGAQKIIMHYLIAQVEENNEEYIVTKAVTIEEFIQECKLTPNTIKGMLQKLKNKKLLETHENKPGRGGYARYKFPKEIYSFFAKNLS